MSGVIVESCPSSSLRDVHGQRFFIHGDGGFEAVGDSGVIIGRVGVGRQTWELATSLPLSGSGVVERSNQPAFVSAPRPVCPRRSS